MAVGREDPALWRIERELIASDPELVASFRRWRAAPAPEPADHGFVRVGGVPLLVLTVGAVVIGTGTVGVVIALLIVLPIWLCRAFG